MWNLGDLSKLGNSFNEVMQKAKQDMEKNMDSALGIDGNAVPVQQPTPAGDAGASPASQVDAAPVAPTAAAAPGDKPTTKKIVKKIIVRKVTKVKPAAAEPGTGSEATSAAATSTATQPDAVLVNGFSSGSSLAALADGVAVHSTGAVLASDPDTSVSTADATPPTATTTPDLASSSHQEAAPTSSSPANRRTANAAAVHVSCDAGGDTSAAQQPPVSSSSAAASPRGALLPSSNHATAVAHDDDDDWGDAGGAWGGTNGIEPPQALLGLDGHTEAADHTQQGEPTTSSSVSTLQAPPAEQHELGETPATSTSPLVPDRPADNGLAADYTSAHLAATDAGAAATVPHVRTDARRASSPAKPKQIAMKPPRPDIATVSAVAAPHPTKDSAAATAAAATATLSGGSAMGDPASQLHASCPSAPTTAPSPAADAPASVSSAAPAASTANGTQGAGGLTHAAELSLLRKDQLEALTVQLQESMSEREAQLLRQAEQMSQMQQLVAQLQDKNEELVLRASKVSENDLEELRTEFEQRIAQAERKVYAISKERDALKKSAEKLTELTTALRAKEETNKQIMTEGERLSKRQIDLESTLKKVRFTLTAVEQERDKLAQKLSAEEANVESQKKARIKAERDLSTALEASAAELALQREHYEQLLQKARTDQVEAEERAREAASLGVARKIKEGDSRVEAMQESLMELRDALDRQRQAAELREEMLKQDVVDLEKRCQAAELRHQDLTAKLPDSMRPLLRQIEAMQAAHEAQVEAWHGAEHSLSQRIADAEARAASATERERHSLDRMQGLQSRIVTMEAALHAARSEAASQASAREEAVHRADESAEHLVAAQHQVDILHERIRALTLQMEQLELTCREEVAAQQSARAAAETDAITVRKEAERRVQELQARVDGLSSSMGNGGMGNGGMDRSPEPPAMAAPGYRWMLVKEGVASGDEGVPLSHSPGSSFRPPPHTQTTPPHSASSPFLAGSGGGDGGGGGRHRAYSSDGSRAADSSSYDDGASTAGLVPSLVSGGSAGQPGMAELEARRAAMRQRAGEIAALEQRIRDLEVTRDSLAEELLAAQRRSDAVDGALGEAERCRQETEDMRRRYVAAVELLGERDEQLDELRADLADVKALYKDHIQFMCAELQTPGGGTAARPGADSAGASGAGTPRHDRPAA